MNFTTIFFMVESVDIITQQSHTQADIHISIHIQIYAYTHIHKSYLHSFVQLYSYL